MYQKNPQVNLWELKNSTKQKKKLEEKDNKNKNKKFNQSLKILQI